MKLLLRANCTYADVSRNLIYKEKMLQSGCKITEIGASNNKPQMVICFQEQEFPTIMEKKLSGVKDYSSFQIDCDMSYTGSL